MHFDHANLAVLDLASKDSYRFVLNGLHFDNGKTVATDGRVIAIVDGITTDDERPAGQRVTLPRPAVKTVARMVPRSTPKKAHAFTLEATADIADRPDLPNVSSLEHATRAHIKPANKFDTATQYHASHEFPEGLTLRAIEGTYPEYQKVIPENPRDAFTVTYNVALLASVLKLAAACKVDSLAFQIVSSHRPTVITGKVEAPGSQDDRRLLCVLMPMRSESYDQTYTPDLMTPCPHCHGTGRAPLATEEPADHE